MLINNLMRNLNNNYNKVDGIQNMMASGRKFAHISDNPTALIYSQTARNKLARLSHYQISVGNAKDWLNQAETGIMELQLTIQNAYESVIDAINDTKNDDDRTNIAQLMGQLRDHYLDTLNAAFGDKFVFGGYNTPGDFQNIGVTAPFALNDDGDLTYNGFNLAQFDSLPTKLLDEDFSGMTAADILARIDDPGDLDLQAEFDDFLTLRGLDPGLAADREEMATALEMMHRLKNDVLSFDIGPAVNMKATMNGIDLVLYATTDANGPLTRNVFSVLAELYEEAYNDDSSAENLITFIKPLQDSQNHLLSRVAEIGGRSRRIELIEARYEQDTINYLQMKSDAEDADMAEVIMNLRMAESILEASLSAGARIIQPTLMDFLR